jgi:hypothetical protein
VPLYAKSRSNWQNDLAGGTPILESNLDWLETAIYEMKIRIVSVHDFGAQGDGATDDTAAIQAALNTSQIVLLPNWGEFLITSRLDVQAGGGIVSNGRGTIKMRGAEFTNTAGATCYGPLGVGISVENDDVLLDNFRIYFDGTDDRHVGAIVVQANNVTVTRIEAWGFTKRPGIINVDSSFDCTISGNFIHDCTTNSATDGQITGIAVDDNLVGGVHSERIHITENKIRDMTVGAAFLASFGYETDGITVAKNATRDLVIANNIIETVGEGIDTFGLGATITGNVIRDAYIFGIKLVHGATGNSVVANIIDRPGLQGITCQGTDDLAQDTADNVIQANTIRDVNQANAWPTGATAALAIGDNLGTTWLPRRNVFKDNKIFNTTAQKYVVAAESSFTGAGNVFEGNDATAGYTTAYSSNTSASRIRDAKKASVRVTLGTAQSILANTTTVVRFDTETLDAQSEFDTATWTYTAKSDRTLHVSAAVRLSAMESTKIWDIFLYKNGVALYRHQVMNGGGAAADLSLTLSVVVAVVRSDTLDIRVLHDETAAHSLTNNATTSYLTIEEVG